MLWLHWTTITWQSCSSTPIHDFSCRRLVQLPPPGESTTLYSQAEAWRARDSTFAPSPADARDSCFRGGAGAWGGKPPVSVPSDRQQWAESARQHPWAVNCGGRARGSVGQAAVAQAWEHGDGRGGMATLLATAGRSSVASTVSASISQTTNRKRSASDGSVYRKTEPTAQYFEIPIPIPTSVIRILKNAEYRQTNTENTDCRFGIILSNSLVSGSGIVGKQLKAV